MQQGSLNTVDLPLGLLGYFIWRGGQAFRLSAERVRQGSTTGRFNDFVCLFRTAELCRRELKMSHICVAERRNQRAFQLPPRDVDEERVDQIGRFTVKLIACSQSPLARKCQPAVTCAMPIA